MNTRSWLICSISALALVAGALLLLNLPKGNSRHGTKHPVDSRRLLEVTNQTSTNVAPRTPRREPYDKTTSAKVDELFNFEPEGFASSWKHISDTFEPEEDRILFLRQIAIRMSSLGCPHEAIDMIKKTFGEGETRTQMVAACFAYAKNFRSLEKCFGLLQFDGEKQAARKAAAICLATEMRESNGTIQYANYNCAFLGLAESELWISAAQQYLSQAGRNGPIDVEACFAKIMGMGIPAGLKTRLLARLSSEVPNLAWREYVKSASSANDPAALQIVRRLVEKDSKLAVDEILTSPGYETMLRAALNCWGTKDSNEAANWLRQNGSTLSSKQYDNALVGMVELSTGKGSFHEANELISDISDSNLKREAEGRVWTAERDSLRKKVGKDPAGTMQSIVSGQSKYGDYWIEEAMSTWVAKDFDKAQDWYQKNWNSMPANKSQYLAAAFAKQAATQGDVATAREWAAHIQDAKTKQRIEAEIAKAAPN